MRNKIFKFILRTTSILILIILLLNVGPYLFPSLVTTYSEGFNKQSFKRISIGEDKKSVESQLGKPLRISIDNVNQDSIKDAYWYSENKYYFLYYEKIFILFYEDKVSDIIRVIDMD